MKSNSCLDLPLLPRLEKETASQFVYRCLRHAVMIGRVSPGRALTIREIAEALNVSMMPVREALRLLAAERALEMRDNRRVQVPNMTAIRFRELCELRVVLETHAALGAMSYVTAERLATLAGLDRRIDIDEANARGDFEQAIVVNQEFHRTIYTANPYQESLPLIESVWLQLGPFLRLALAKLGGFYQIDRHVEAMEALRRRDPIALRVAIEADIRDGIMHVGTADLLNAYTQAIDAERPPRRRAI
ncbi:DNA-binding GntR family transcriptional regulator [Pseudochelatococcus lubricantis]|uniref:DNA-binding GntR family transcriptional regulator n=1 Tax=Pseudochelatococcus lubricantis TaxID=1538102 RepID=A0ABX0UXV9_9HYPH|nr:GntR family transcriptional regulator [Pseudochelatococcus lubricantis]NIJ56735.1 DNA-binding GntR family transcriptional regulator [Pseudochelatococcus lubricantis]